jgi:hypothetical protein
MCGVLRAGVAALVAATPTVSYATDEPHASLQWTAPEGCLSEEELAAALTARLGRNAVAPREEADVHVTGDLRPAGTGHVATLWLRDADGRMLGERRLSTDGACRTLDASLALVLALLVEHAAERVRLHVASEVPEEQIPAVHAATRAGRAAGVPTTPTRRERWMVGVAIGATASVGDRPEPLLAPWGALSVHGPFGASLELEASVGPPKDLIVVDRGVTLWSFMLGGSLCAEVVANARLALSGCGGARGGVFEARGLGAAADLATQRTFGEVTVRARLEVATGVPVGLRIDVGVAFVPRPLSVVYTDGGGAPQMAWQRSAVVPFLTLAGFVQGR